MGKLCDPGLIETERGGFETRYGSREGHWPQEWWVCSQQLSPEIVRPMWSSKGQTANKSGTASKFNLSMDYLSMTLHMTPNAAMLFAQTSPSPMILSPSGNLSRPSWGRSREGPGRTQRRQMRAWPLPQRKAPAFTQ